MIRMKFRTTIKYAFLLTVIVIILILSGTFTRLLERNFYTDFQYPYNGNIIDAVSDKRSGIPNAIKPINSYNYSYIHNCSNKCETSLNEPIRIVFLIKSAPKNVMRRIAIRKTWGNEKRFFDVKIRTVFLLGITDEKSVDVTYELNKWDDLIQADFVDSYYNNTIKTMVGFQWVSKFCASAMFYMLVDDDYLVSPKNLLHFLRFPTNYPKWDSAAKSVKMLDVDYNLPDNVELYSGFVFESRPHRHPFGKWYVSLDEYPYHKWPPYVTAGAVVLSREAILQMYYASFFTKHFRFDDIYMGILAMKVGIKPFHHNAFHFYREDYTNENYKSVIASHGYGNPLELVTVWNELKSFGRV